MRFRRRVLARLRLEADRAAATAFEVADAMLRPSPPPAPPAATKIVVLPGGHVERHYHATRDGWR